MSSYFNIYVCIPKQHLVLSWFGIGIHCFILCESFCNLPFLLSIIHEDLFMLLLVALLDSF